MRGPAECSYKKSLLSGRYITIIICPIILSRHRAIFAVPMLQNISHIYDIIVKWLNQWNLT